MSAVSFTNTAGGAWNLGSNWSSGLVPGTTDDITIGATIVGNITITTTAAVCRSLNCTGFTKNLSTAVNITIGDGTAGASNIALKFTSSMTFTRTAGAMTFASTSATQQSIDFGNVTTSAMNVTINGASSSYTLTGFSSGSGPWILGGSTTLQLIGTFNSTGTFTANTCTYDLNGQSHTSSAFSSTTGTRVFKNTAGGGSMTVTGVYSITGTTVTTAWGTATLNCGGSLTHTATSGTATSFFQTVNFTGFGNVITLAATGFGSTTQFTSTTITMSGGTQTFTGATSAGITYTGLTVNITGSGTNVITNGVGIPTLSCTLSAQGDALQVPTNRALTCTTLTLTGTTLNMLLVTSGVIGTAATISAGTLTASHITWQDITGSGAAVPFAGTDMGNMLGCTNITFDANRTLYWVGGTGNANDSAHWSLSSGGAGGQVAVRAQDTMVFDSSSFSGGGQIVSMNRLYYGSWTITTPSNNPTFNFSALCNFTGGWTHTGTFQTTNGNISINFVSRTSATISGSANSGLMGAFNFSNSLNATYTLAGTLNINTFSVSGVSGMTLNCGSATISCTGSVNWAAATTASTFNFGSSSWTIPTGSIGFGVNWTYPTNTAVLHLTPSSGTMSLQGIAAGAMPGLSFEATGTGAFQFGSLGTWNSSSTITLVSGTLTSSSLTGTTTCTAFTVQGGTLNVTIPALVCTSFNITGGTITSAFTGITLNASGATTFATNGATLPSVIMNLSAGAAVSATGAALIPSLTVNGQAAAGQSVTFATGITVAGTWLTDKSVSYTMHAGSTHRAGTLQHTNGGATKRLSMVSSTPGTRYNNIFASLVGPLSYVDITDSNATNLVFPSIRSYSAPVSVASVTSVVVNKPAGTVQGDYMVALVSILSANVVAPSGWTQIGTGILGFSAWTKPAGVSEPSTYTWSTTGSATDMRGMIVTIGAASALDSGGVQEVVLTNLITFPATSVTTHDACFVLYLSMNANPAAAYVSPSPSTATNYFIDNADARFNVSISYGALLNFPGAALGIGSATSVSGNFASMQVTAVLAT